MLRDRRFRAADSRADHTGGCAQIVSSGLWPGLAAGRSRAMSGHTSMASPQAVNSARPGAAESRGRAGWCWCCRAAVRRRSPCPGRCCVAADSGAVSAGRAGHRDGGGDVGCGGELVWPDGPGGTVPPFGQDRCPRALWLILAHLENLPFPDRDRVLAGLDALDPEGLAEPGRTARVAGSGRQPPQLVISTAAASLTRTVPGW
jgi:hypothetical protein